jgi:putative endonuclease
VNVFGIAASASGDIETSSGIAASASGLLAMNNMGELMAEKSYYVYIMTNRNKTTLYTGVTGNLYRRVLEHKHCMGSVFTRRYNLTKLVYYEPVGNLQAAVGREKQIKAGSRQKKMALIESINPGWKDLFEDM